MPKFIITLRRETTEETSFEIEAESQAAANIEADEYLRNTLFCDELDWKQTLDVEDSVAEVSPAIAGQTENHVVVVESNNGTLLVAFLDNEGRCVDLGWPLCSDGEGREYVQFALDCPNHHCDVEMARTSEPSDAWEAIRQDCTGIAPAPQVLPGMPEDFISGSDWHFVANAKGSMFQTYKYAMRYRARAFFRC